MKLKKKIELTCKKCGKTQTYNPRSNKIPKRPKTQCQNIDCKAWIYFDGSLLVMDGQRPNDQTKPDDQKTKIKSLKIGKGTSKTTFHKSDSIIKIDQKLDDQRPKDQEIDQKPSKKLTKKSEENIIRPKKVKLASLTKNDQMTKKRPIDQNLFQYIRSISGDLVIALNYAINSIKNKPEVKERKKGATRYDYFKNWSQYREFFKRMSEDIKKELGIIKEDNSYVESNE